MSRGALALLPLVLLWSSGCDDDEPLAPADAVAPADAAVPFDAAVPHDAQSAPVDVAIAHDATVGDAAAETVDVADATAEAGADTGKDASESDVFDFVWEESETNLTAKQFLDDCFADLGPLAMTWQLSVKRAFARPADPQPELRMAFEVPAGEIASAGTRPWRLARFGLFWHARVCVKDPRLLRAAYHSSPQNCLDRLAINDPGPMGRFVAVYGPNLPSSTLFVTPATVATEFADVSCLEDTGTCKRPNSCP
jgi:hypothetical protein